MALVNIGGDPDDPNYRYKRNKTKSKIEGRGNGIKTLVPNVVEIAKQLHTEPGWLIKFWGIELGAQSKFDKKTERGIVNGAHQAADLEDILNKFIEEFILCPGCGMPELAHRVNKSGVLLFKCAACGYNEPYKRAHRLLKYIQTHPPKGKGGKSKKNETKQERRARKEAERLARSQASKSSSKPRKSEKVVWHTDVSEEAQQARREIEFQSMGFDKVLADASRSQRKQEKKKSPSQILREYLDHEDRSTEDIIAEIARLKISRGLDNTKRVRLIFNAMFDITDAASIAPTMKKYSEVLAQFSGDEDDKEETKIFIGELEYLIGQTCTDLLPRTPLIFKTLYDADVLDEDMILEWANQPVGNAWVVGADVEREVRQLAAPFTNWLQEADEESGDDESGDEDGDDA